MPGLSKSAAAGVVTALPGATQLDGSTGGTSLAGLALVLVIFDVSC